MIDLNHQNEWQHRDETGLILPWYTKSFLDELVTWELKDKWVLEFGMGASSIWWNQKVAKLTCYDYDKGWYEAVKARLDFTRAYSKLLLPNVPIVRLYDSIACEFDIAIVDIDPVIERDPAIAIAMHFLKPGGRLIIDNWDQPSVWVPSNETRKLLADWPVKIYPQEGHEDWKTACFIKP